MDFLGDTHNPLAAKTFKIFLLSILLIYSIFLILRSTSAPIMAYLHKYDLSAQLTSLYMFSCHQQPDRSFWIFNYPIAICCRCYGFYLGIIISSLLMLLIENLKINIKTIITMSVIILVDLAINYFKQNVNTGNFVRFTVGLMMGMIFIIIIDQILTIKRRKV